MRNFQMLRFVSKKRLDVMVDCEFIYFCFKNVSRSDSSRKKCTYILKMSLS